MSESNEYIQKSTRFRDSLNLTTQKNRQPSILITTLIQEYKSNNVTLDNAISQIIKSTHEDGYKKYWINRLIAGANSIEDIPGLVLIMNNDFLKQSRTDARKALYNLDIANSTALN